MKHVFKLSLYIALIAVAMTLNGFAITILWDWFVVQQFGLAALNIPQAIGLSLIMAYVTHQLPSKSAVERSLSDHATYMLTKPFTFLLLGWIVTKFL